jgi:hypothetical protein
MATPAGFLYNYRHLLYSFTGYSNAPHLLFYEPGIYQQ